MKDDDKGYTNIILHSDKARKIIGELSDINIYPADATKMFLYTGGMESKSIKLPENRPKFFEELKVVTIDNFDKFIKSYVPVTKKDILIEKSKLILYKTGILKVLRKLK